MDFWSAVLFAVASYLALKSLVTLMAYYRRVYASRFLAEELERRAQSEPAEPQTDQQSQEPSPEGSSTPPNRQAAQPTGSKAA